MLDEIQKVAATEPAYCFDYFIMLFPLYNEEEKDEGELTIEQGDKDSSLEHKKMKVIGGKKNKISSKEKVIESYHYFEAEYLEKHAEFVFNITNPTSSGRSQRGMVFTLSGLEQGITILKKLVNESDYVISQSKA
ncbi:hypothetical protein HMI55_003854 [Coelomomyces lativittatus]|nr:hypothetical protein HMI55_003854 [Coelomomyces lativittatus]